jgi:carboxyl-terminal processing protease
MQLTRFHRQLAAKSFIINANLKYVDRYRKELKKNYPNFTYLRDHYVVPKAVIDGIIEEAKKQNITPRDDEGLQRTIASLRIQLKALVARDLWDMSEYFSVLNERSEIVKKALEVMGAI